MKPAGSSHYDRATCGVLVSSHSHSRSRCRGNPRYLYRYFVWNQANLIFGRHDYQRFPFHLVQPGDSTFHFVLGSANSIPQKIRYTERGITRERDLTEFLVSTHTTAFIVVQDDKLLYERYLNGQRASVHMDGRRPNRFDKCPLEIAESSESTRLHVMALP